MSWSRWAASFAGIASLAACDSILHIPDRTLGDNLVCADGQCACVTGFGDCDGDPSNGCEADLTAAANCGACGHACQNGACTAGSCACQTGFSDCDGNPANGCEANLDTAPRDCGTCGHDCLGGACTMGLCQPFTLYGLSYPQDLEVAGGSLLVTECPNPVASPLLSLSPAGGSTVDQATNVDCGVFETITGSTVYWSNGDGIFSNSLLTPAPPQTFLATTTADALAATTTQLYWTSFNGTSMAGGLRRSPLAGGPAVTISNRKVIGLAVDDANAYWSDDMGLYSVPHIDTMPVTLAGAVQPGALTVDATSIYFMENSMAGGGLESLPLAGGTPKVLAPDAATFALKVDGKYLYWLDFGDSNVYQLSLTDLKMRVLAVGLGGASNAAIAVDATAVYWLSDQSLFKMAK